MFDSIFKSEKKSCTYNMLANSAVGIFVTICQVILNYAVRIVFVNTLGAEINGLHNLFQSLINVMLLMESGFSTALIIHMYKPVEMNDQAGIIEVMSFYKRVYTTVACFLIIVGLLVDAFFLDKLITTTIPMMHVRIYFFAFVLAFALYYNTYYKKSILFANQQNRVNTWAMFVSELVFRIFEVIAVVRLHQYLAFLILMIFEKLFCNTILNIYVDRHYPYLRNFRSVRVSDKIKRSVFKTVKPILVFNISSTVQQSAKGILISCLMGNIRMVGYYGNYQMVAGAATLLYGQLGGAYTSAIGNLAVSGNKEKVYHFYRNCSFWMNWCAILIAAGICTCIQDFIMMTFGREYLLPMNCTIVVVMDMLTYLFSIPIISVQNAVGLHHLDQKYMVIQTITAIILGFIGGNYFGIPGIVSGLILPQILFTLFYKGICINKTAFGKGPLMHIRMMTGEIIKSAAVISVCLMVCSLISTGNPVINFLTKGITTVGVCVLLCCLSSWRSPYFQKIFTIAKWNKRKGI